MKYNLFHSNVISTVETPGTVMAVVRCNRCHEHVMVWSGNSTPCSSCGRVYSIKTQVIVQYEHPYDPFNPRD